MAKSIKISRPHNTSSEAALAKMQSLAADIRNSYGLAVNFSGSTAKVKGKGVSGTVRATASDIVFDLRLGLPASLAAGKIEKGIHAALDKHMG